MQPINGLGDKAICQVCLVVDDAEKYARRYAEIFGLELGEPLLTSGFDHTEATHYGKPTEAKARIYYWRFGEVDFEVLQPLGPGSVWQDWLDAHGPSIHHIALRVKDTAGVTREFARFGYPVGQQGFFEGLLPNGGHTGMYTYVDTIKGFGTTIELLEEFDPNREAR
jgi:catechol 2,3-dioxygenase-like lactoylglutathione lyase family enzyme